MIMRMATNVDKQYVPSEASNKSEKLAKKNPLAGKLGIGEMFATKVALAALKKSCRGTKAQLQRERAKIYSIQIDLGVSLLTGDPIRQPIKLLPSEYVDKVKMVDVLKREKE